MTMTVAEKPKARALVNDITDEEINQYLARAQKIGYKPDEDAILFEQLKVFLADNNIPVYDDRQVFDWMTQKAREKGKTWIWVPLREKDKNKSDRCRYHLEGPLNPQRPWENMVGRVIGRLYHRVIPPAVLTTIEKIAGGFPEANLFVSDLAEVPRPDPFLAVTLPGHPFLVVDFWDEPGFKPKMKEE